MEEVLVKRIILIAFAVIAFAAMVYMVVRLGGKG
jgi:hypothetical protein